MSLTQPNPIHVGWVKKSSQPDPCTPLYVIVEGYDLTNLKPTYIGSANQNPLSMIWITTVNQTLQTKLT